MLVEIKGGIGDVGRVVLDDVMEEGVAELFLFAHQLRQVNDQDGGIQSELLIQVSAEGFMGLLVSWWTKKTNILHVSILSPELWYGMIIHSHLLKYLVNHQGILWMTMSCHKA